MKTWTMQRRTSIHIKTRPRTSPRSSSQERRSKSLRCLPAQAFARRSHFLVPPSALGMGAYELHQAAIENHGTALKERRGRIATFSEMHLTSNARSWGFRRSADDGHCRLTRSPPSNSRAERVNFCSLAEIGTNDTAQRFRRMPVYFFDAQSEIPTMTKRYLVGH